jgi:hypothetical protein
MTTTDPTTQATMPIRTARLRRAHLLPAAVMAGCGLASAGIYLSFTLRMSLTEYFPGPGYSIDFKDMLGPDWEANTRYLYGSFAMLFGLWFGALWAAARLPVRLALGLCFGGLVLFAGILASVYPFMAVDFFHNLGDGRLLWRYGLNPLVNGPGPYFPIGISFGDNPSAYGPFWYLLLAPPVKLGGDDYLRSLILLKLWMGVFLVIATLLTWQIARRLAPGREGLACVLLAWNPYVVHRVLANGHNDVVMMCFTLLAVWMALERRWTWVAPALACAVLVKYTILLATPAFLFAALRLPAGERRRALLRLFDGSLIGAGLILLAFLPFWAGTDTFDSIRWQAGLYITSTPMLVAYFLERWGDFQRVDAEPLATRVLTVLFLCFALVLFLRQRRGPVSLIATCVLVMLGYLLLAVNWFRPWYFLWAVMLTPLLPGRWWIVITVAISMGGLTPDVIEQYRGNMTWLHRDYFWLLGAPVLTAFIPPAVAVVAGYVATLRREMDADQPPDPSPEPEPGIAPAPA